MLLTIRRRRRQEAAATPAVAVVTLTVTVEPDECNFITELYVTFSDSEKAISQGWGHQTENLDETAPVDKQSLFYTNSNFISVETKEAESPAAEAVVDPEDNVKTLEEYYAELKAQKAQAEESAKQIRQANEGVDDSKWKGAVALKKEEESFFVGKVNILSAFHIHGMSVQSSQGPQTEGKGHQERS